MKKHVIIFSLCAVVVMITASFASVVGFRTTSETNPRSASPLFAVRTQQATQQTPVTGVARFLGEGTKTSLFPMPSSQNELLKTALQFFTKHPVIFTRLVQNLVAYPYIASLLTKQGITPQEITASVWMLQQHPSLVQEALADVNDLADNNGPQPRGLSTSNPLGCFIVAAFALIPITITLTLLLLFFTLRILTCMNVNDCANALAQQIWTQLIQGLTQQ